MEQASRSNIWKYIWMTCVKWDHGFQWLHKHWCLYWMH